MGQAVQDYCYLHLYIDAPCYSMGHQGLLKHKYAIEMPKIVLQDANNAGPEAILKNLKGIFQA